MKDTLYLLDATALLYRAYFAFIRNPLINSKGMNTNAIFGVVNSFMSFVQKFDPSHIIVSFDRKGPTFRHERSELYKANRPPMPDDLIPQVQPVIRFFGDMGLQEISREGLEADDILATLAYMLKDKYEIIIVTGDKDYSQLVQDGVTLYDPMKDIMIDRAGVIAKYGITPEQFVDYLALIGDSSDNIPGVKGIGPKGAEKLLQEYQNLDGIYNNIDKITGSTKDKLLADKENAYLSQELAQMVLDAPIDMPGVEAVHFHRSDLAKALPILEEYEMPTLRKRLLGFLPQGDFTTKDTKSTKGINVGRPPSADQDLAFEQDRRPALHDSDMSGNQVNKRTEQLTRTGNETDLFQDDLFGNDFGGVTPIEVLATVTNRSEQPRQFEAILVNTWELFEDVISAISASSLVSLDTETTSIDSQTAELVGISICTETDKAYYIPIAHALADNLDKAKVIQRLQEVLSPGQPGAANPHVEQDADPAKTVAVPFTGTQVAEAFVSGIANLCYGTKTIIGHNLKYDLTVLKNCGWDICNPIFDTMLAAYILDAGINQYSMDACALNELKYVMQPISELIGTGKNQITFDLVEVEKACFYSAEDAWVAFRLQQIYQKKLEYSGLERIYYRIELPLVKPLEYMEANGVHIDTSVLSGISHLLNAQIKELTDKIYEAAGYQFNINSTQQLAKLLFEEMQLPGKKKTKTGFSTDNSVLEELADEYEIASLVSEYRQLTKLDSTYVSALLRMINPVTKRVHSSFNQTIASTGRLSSTNPNLQNIPIRTEVGRQIRKAFCAADDDTVIVSADYSQIELRLLAMMSHDPVLLEAFAKGVDIHRQTSAYINHKTLEEVSNDERRAAKAINFGLLYGMGPVKLSKELGITQTVAKEIIAHYFEEFSSIRDFIQNCYNEARKNRYSETIFGRRLYLPFINSSNQKLKSEAERVAVNMPIQGTAADLIKLAMIDIYHQIKADKEIKMILQVHDELVFEVKKSALDRALPLIKTAMTNALPEEYRSLISLEVEAGYGKSWFEAHT